MSDGQLKTALIITLLLFLATLSAGWLWTVQDPSMGENLKNMFEQQIAGQLNVDNPYEMSLNLFVNNLEACILLFLGGASLGIFTVFILSLNGIVIGAIVEIVRHEHSWAFVGAAIIPHGIFEIPAFIIAGAIGLILTRSFLTEWHGIGDMADDAHRLGRIFATYVLPLVAVAAFVEAFITPAVIQLVI